MSGVVELMDFIESVAAQRRLHELVPGGSHTYARGSDQYPAGLAPVIASGHGARVVDLDGNEFVEYGMGLRSVTLGHAYAPVVDAVAPSRGRRGQLLEAVASGSRERPSGSWTRCRRADMVKFAKNGSDATTAALRLARAVTGRELVAICRDQPFFSVDDWFIGTTEMSAGMPESVRRTTTGFGYNDLASLEALLARHPGQVAAVFLEAATGTAEPAPGFLEGLRDLADRDGFVLVFDEMITGMRWASGGAQAVYGVTPDLSTWGKALGNGFAVSALAGRRELMELGGLNTDDERVFLLSTTHGAETTGLAAFLAVSEAYAERDVVAVMERQGAALRARFEDLVAGDTDWRASCRCRAGRRAWSTPRATTRAHRPRRSGPCSSRSCSTAACSGSRSSSRRPTRTRTSTGRSRRATGHWPSTPRLCPPGRRTVTSWSAGRPGRPPVRRAASPLRSRTWRHPRLLARISPNTSHGSPACAPMEGNCLHGGAVGAEAAGAGHRVWIRPPVPHPRRSRRARGASQGTHPTTTAKGLEPPRARQAPTAADPSCLQGVLRLGGPSSRPCSDRTLRGEVHGPEGTARNVTRGGGSPP